MFSGHTDIVRESGQRSSRNGERVRSILIHHAATTDAAGVVGMMVSGSRTVSSNYVIGRDGTVYGVVPEEYRAWTSGSASDGGKGAAWDRRSVTFECANLSTNGWTISDATYESVSDVMADVATRNGFELNRDTVLGHRELWSRFRASYATACPGGFDLDRLVNMARAKMGRGALPAFAGSIGAGATPGAAYQEAMPVKEYQAALIALGYDLGQWGADGNKGAATTAAVVKAQRDAGLDADGLVGPNTVTWLRGQLAAKGLAKPVAPAATAPAFPLPEGSYFGPRSGPAASVSGYFSHREDLRRWQAQMKARGWAIDVDGLYGTQTGDVAESFQREKGLDVDRLIGRATWSAAWTAPVT